MDIQAIFDTIKKACCVEECVDTTPEAYDGFGKELKVGDIVIAKSAGETRTYFGKYEVLFIKDNGIIGIRYLFNPYSKYREVSAKTVLKAGE